jgi:hypothetical protein
MNTLTESEIAWLAGIYEGEGSAWAQGQGRAISVAIVMTDFDIIDRIFALVGTGSVRDGKHANEAHKPFRTWSVTSLNAVEFLETIMPWLGARRAAKARELISRWRNDRQQISKYDTVCIVGHSLIGMKRTASGGCRTCANEASRRYRARKREQSILL